MADPLIKFRKTAVGVDYYNLIDAAPRFLGQVENNFGANLGCTLTKSHLASKPIFALSGCFELTSVMIQKRAEKFSNNCEEYYVNVMLTCLHVMFLFYFFHCLLVVVTRLT